MTQKVLLQVGDLCQFGGTHWWVEEVGGEFMAKGRCIRSGAAGYVPGAAHGLGREAEPDAIIGRNIATYEAATALAALLH